ncbi:DUF1960-domain-containing protein [Basidiobolus meristosporus CBS 931.73]|uniref:DUF1960-domain-containing protein n=1 Tax=Basidiobolus meristosporus CBS 931.73 TaxID=1314790 RepID=A0A1Y1YB72_9FUNG|nr:DUF1960-domain-containing protein [Basidiobolus meristosporus CBS 931.73]|eukprot:ORX94864.1 DUF1960-domain-containing protein [Basidiobolus meristosporus CBS 931.73]
MAATQQVVFSDKEKSDTEFFVFVNPEVYEEWESDKSVPISKVVQAFNIYVTRTGGSTGVAETPSNQELENTFGTSNDTAVVEHILKHGVAKGSSGIRKTGDKFNLSRGRGVSTSDASNNVHN